MAADERFDCIIVGARCAGASLAIRLGRAGQKVLLLDAGKRSSDQPMSTHFVSAVGVDWLDELGVGAEVRRLSPPSHVLRLDLAGTTLDVPFQRGRAGHCLRRLHLDRLLQEGAVRAGAVLRDETKVLALVRENDRVAGVEAVHDGVRQTYRARIVVGADGRHSTVAELAGAKEYLGYDNTRFGYWAYWPAKPAWTHPGLRSFDAYTGFSEDKNVRFIFQTDSDLLLIGVTPPMAHLPSWRGRHEEAYLDAMRASRVTAPLIENNQRVGKLVGILSARFFFREAVGPGFALVGDSGLHKDPTPGFGITDALRDSRSLAQAILTGTEGALARYWRQRDVDSIDLFRFATDMAEPDYVNPFNRLVFEHFRESPEILARLGAQLDRQLSPFDVVPTPTVLRWVMGATLRGNLPVIPSFVRTAKRNARVRRERRERRALLDAAPRT